MSEEQPIVADEVGTVPAVIPPEIWLVNDLLIWVPTPEPIYADINIEDPDARPQVPFNGRLKQPPALSARQVARSLGHDENAEWEILADFVGFVYWTMDHQKVTITEYGVSPPADGTYHTEDPGPTDAQAWATFQRNVKAALIKSGETVERIIEGVSLGQTALVKPDVVAYMQWRGKLRALLSVEMPADKTNWPAIPDSPGFPAGT